MARTTPAQNPRGFASTTFLSPIHNPPFNGPGGEFQCTPQPSPQWRHGVTSNAFFSLAPIGERGPGVREHLDRTHFCTPSFGSLALRHGTHITGQVSIQARLIYHFGLQLSITSFYAAASGP